jgi:hypothetical protein
VLRVDPGDRDALTSVGHPYFVPQPGHLHRDRLGVQLNDRTDRTEIHELVTESYQLIAPKKLIALIGHQHW